MSAPAQKRETATTIAMVRRWYDRALRALVDELRPRFEAGELREGWPYNEVRVARGGRS